MINSTLCYLERDGKYLMLHRVKKQGDVNKDKWIGVGGKLEERESPLECVRREVLEETGLTVEQPRYCGLITFVSDRWETEQMHLFHSREFHGELLSDCREGDLEWVEKTRLEELNLWKGDCIFLDLMAREVPFFSLKLVYEGDQLIEAVLNGQKLQ